MMGNFAIAERNVLSDFWSRKYFFDYEIKD